MCATAQLLAFIICETMLWPTDSYYVPTKQQQHFKKGLVYYVTKNTNPKGLCLLCIKK